jgi:hypothetical protein
VSERPKVRCLIARPLKNGGIGKSRLVSLSTAFLALKAEFLVVGPDPQDCEDLARWEREQVFANTPRWAAGEVPE